jgi:formylglycine-generating enzyme required for sulfatase activity
MSDPAAKPTVTIAPSEFTPLHRAEPSAPRPRKPRRALLIACLALFALAMLFLFNARSLHVVVDAQAPSSVSVSGLALPLGKRYLLLPGDYEVRATAEGYQPLVTDVTVDERDDQSLELKLQALPGLVSIISTPPGATVTVGGQAVGRTPLSDLPLPEGEHPLSLQEARHLPLAQTLQVTGRGVRQQLTLEMLPAWANVKVDSVPPGASILVDGEREGQTPASVEMLQGERQLMLQLPSFAHWQKSLRVTAGQDQDLGQVTLQPAPGLLELGSIPSGANVTLDGDFLGQTPLTVEIAPGRTHTLAVSKPGFERYDDSVAMASGSRDARSVTLKAQLGEVRLRISPDAATVRIDGKPLAKATRTVSLPAVEHTVEVSLDGYATQRRRVTPRPGLPQLVEVNLQSSQSTGASTASAGKLGSTITTALGQTLRLFKPGESELADFTLGASRREPGRRANEVLQPVALRRMFYLQTTEVTNAQFRQFAPRHDSGQAGGKSLNGDQQPAVQVSWQQAAAFCNWLSAKEGLPPFYRQSNGVITGFDSAATGYRLPSEAEWTWAARASGAQLVLFPWGSTFPPTAAVENYADESAAYITGRVISNYQDGHAVSAPAGAFKPNQHGLYDMGGNVSEWVHDVYVIPPANSATLQDPLGGQTGDNYTIRGAAWTHSKLSELRLAYRDYGQAGRDDVGFRLARYAE